MMIRQMEIGHHNDDGVSSKIGLPRLFNNERPDSVKLVIPELSIDETEIKPSHCLSKPEARASRWPLKPRGALRGWGLKKKGYLLETPT